MNDRALMNDRKIKKLRNKIWLSLWVSFFAITVFTLTTVYLSHVTFHHQQFQNARRHIGRLEMETLLDSDALHGVFVVESTLNGQLLSIQGDTTFDLDQATEIRDLIRVQTSSRIRDRFLWRVPTPFITFDETYWFFTAIDGHEIDRMINQEVMDEVVNELYVDDRGLSTSPIQDRVVYHLFWDATFVQHAIEETRVNFAVAGMVAFVLLGGIFYVVANFIVKPIGGAFERQKQFIADASHELKTPLAMIKNNLSVFRLNEEMTIASQVHWLDNVQFGFDRMSHLTTDLLTLAKLEEPLGQSKVSEFDFSQAASWVVHSMKSLADAKAIDLSHEIQPDVYVKQDAEKIMQVMTILIDNAIKYAGVGGWIELQVKRKRQVVTFTIVNGGPGIPSEKLPHIFERFYTVDEARNSENKSYGLGLAIAKMMVEQAGGTIKATSIENERTTLCFSLKVTEQ